MIKELGIGIGLAVMVFFGLEGYDLSPALIIIGLGFLLRSMISGKVGGSGRFELLGKRGAQTSGIKNISFDDIGGQEVAKRELLESLDFVKDIEKVKALGIRPIRGILLSGPPGTGKTLLAKAASRYIDSVFISAEGSSFVEVYAGVGAQRVRELFKNARQFVKKSNKENAVIFIDEIDVLGGKRGQHSSHLEYDQTLNQLLVEMDGITADDEVRILVIAATNRADLLDPALLRPGRFDRIVNVGLPDVDGRAHILEIHTKKKPLDKDVDLGELAKETFGFSGAHLENLTNEAAIMAFREGKDRISLRDFRDALDKVMLGERLERRPSGKEMQRIAVHETGHAIISEMVRRGSVSTITVTSRGNALGYMRQTPKDDMYIYTKEYIEDQIAVCLAGLIAEEIILGDRSTGATNDLEQASSYAKRMVKSGMSPLGLVGAELPLKLSHEAVAKILGDQEERVRCILSKKRDLIASVTDILLEREKITGDEFRGMLYESKVS